MSGIQHLFGLLGSLLLMIALLLHLIRPLHLKPHSLTWILLLTASAVCIPINQLAIVAYLRGIISDLSITSMLLLSLFIAKPYIGRVMMDSRSEQCLIRILLCTGFIVYPSALGLLPWDSYTLGYGHLGALFILAVLGIYLAIQANWSVLAILLIALYAYWFGLLASTNLWDYLIDIWLFLFILIRIILTVLFKFFNTTTHT